VVLETIARMDKRAGIQLRQTHEHWHPMRREVASIAGFFTKACREGKPAVATGVTSWFQFSMIVSL